MPNDSFYAIPEELRTSKHWSLWKLEYPNGTDSKPTKVPYSYRGTKASVTNPEDWCTFDIAHEVYSRGGYAGLGFVFADSNPYSGIDLDDPSGDQEITARQIKIFNEFDSYSEVSPSGTGLHIIVKGKVPSGRRRDKIEIYSSGRYFTMTGKVYSGKPIAERQSLLDQLWGQMGGEAKPIFLPAADEPQRHEDAIIIQMAADAENGDKFKALWNGDGSVLTSVDKSGSAIDQALVNIIQFYTNNIEQIERIWLSSPQGKRDKTQKRADYRKRTIQIAFDRAPMKIDMQGYVENINEQLAIINGKSLEQPYNGSVAQRLVPVAHNGSDTGSNPVTSTITPPPGLVGEIAQFIYRAAPRPVPEIAVAGAMGLMAGICGRAYNVSGTGLNQYILCLAMTGAGKEAIASGIDKLIDAVSLSVPVASEFVGPSEIASGQALIKYLSNKSQSFVSVLGEFGIRLKAISSPKASSAEITLRRMLLDLYNKSGHGQSARPSIYSDVDKNTNVIASPSFSIVGESTPERFYEALDDSMIYEGLLPRFTLIEYHGGRPPFNPQAQHHHPSMMLVQKIAELMANVKTVMANRKVVNIKFEIDAEKRLHAFDKYSDDKINNTDKEIIRQLWNRAHIKAMKIAGLIACGVDMFDPTITIENVEWAISLVETDIRSLSKKFESGQVGLTPSETLRINDLKRAIVRYIKTPMDKHRAYKFITASMHANKVIPYKYLSNRVSNLKSYKDTRFTPTEILAKTLKVLTDTDCIQEVSTKQMADVYNTRQRAFVLSNLDIIDEVEMDE